MVWDVEERAQRDRAMSELRLRGFECDIPPRRLGDRFAFCVSEVPDDRRSEVAATVLGIASDATLHE